EEALLVPLGDSDALGHAIVRLLEDRELATRLARAGRVKVREYDFEGVARSYERIFRDARRPLPGSTRLLGAFFLELLRSVASRLGLSREPTLKIDLVGLN